MEKRTGLLLLVLWVALCMFLAPIAVYAQDCPCVYYETRHLSRVEGHPQLGDWDLLRPVCVPFDSTGHVMVSAEGTTASKFEVTLVETGDCEHDNTNPMVEFVDADNVPITDPTPEEHGEITITNMTSTSIFFEYRHPTDPPENGKKTRIVYVAIKDSSAVNEQYFQAGRIAINVYRPPVVLVHGLWSDGYSMNAMFDLLTSDEYEEQMVLAVNYEPTHDASFSTNANVVPTGINVLVTQCRSSFISAGKVNLVGHSMGGILSRLYLQNAYHNDVYRLITCNTPHSGAQTANFLVDPYWNPVNTQLGPILNTLGCPWQEGAIDDLIVTSPAIAAMNAGAHPGDVGVHALATTTDVPTPWDLLASYQESHESKSIVLPIVATLLTTCQGLILDNLFDDDDHDAVVALASQMGGLSGAKASLITDQLHMGSTANHGVIIVVKDLLNQPYDSDNFTFSGYSAPVLSYTNNLGCNNLFTGGEVASNRSVDALTFGSPAPDEQTWTGGDTASITVFGPGVDTIILIYEIDADQVSIQKLPGPEATFNIEIADEQDGSAGLVAFGYSADNEFIGFIGTSMDIEPAYRLTGISVFPLNICAGIGDTNDFQIIGHYDDSINRSLNGHPDLNFQFTTWSASNTGSDDIVLDFPMDDTLVVHIDTFSSTMVKIQYSASPGGAVFWLGGNGNWNDDTMWNIGCPPGPENTAYINAGQCTIPDLVTARARAISLTTASLIVDGSLTLSGATGEALNINKGEVQNNGEIQIIEAANSGIVLQGTASDSAFFTNRGNVSISICDGTYGVYIGPKTFFLNDTSGTITIDSCGMSRSMEIQSQSAISLENLGAISVDGGPVSGTGHILNSGSFTLHHTIPNTYGGFSAVYLRNTASGTMHFENISGNAIHMQYSGDSLINEGTMTIANATDQGVHSYFCQNSGVMQLSNITNEAVFMEGNNYFFQNTDSGLLQISNCGIGIYVRNAGSHFENNGSVEIDTTTAQGILVKFNGRLSNDTDGSIFMRQCGTHGINVLDNTSTKVENFGKIEITESTENGVHASGNGLFENDSTGQMLFYNITGSCLATSGNSLQGNTSISNAGRIDIKLPVGAYGINNTKKFTNTSCGFVLTEKGVRSVQGSFINNGFMHFRNADAHAITTKITSNGWIEDLGGLLNPATQLTNNGALASPVDYGGCSGDSIPDFFTLGSLTGFTTSNGFTDDALTITAGTFDSLSNSFTPNSDGILSPSWFFAVTNMSEGCTDTIELTPRVVCPVTCSGDPFYWTGCTDNNWSNTGNWNLGTVPTATDTVTIPGFPAGALFPQIPVSVSLSRLYLQPNSELTVKTGASLSVID